MIPKSLDESARVTETFKSLRRLHVRYLAANGLKTTII